MEEQQTENARSRAMKKAWESPTVRARYAKGFRRRWTRAARQAHSRRMREAWRERKAREST